jgi:hypothetical protein
VVVLTFKSSLDSWNALLRVVRLSDCSLLTINCCLVFWGFRVCIYLCLDYYLYVVPSFYCVLRRIRALYSVCSVVVVLFVVKALSPILSSDRVSRIKKPAIVRDKRNLVMGPRWDPGSKTDRLTE